MCDRLYVRKSDAEMTWEKAGRDMVKEQAREVLEIEVTPMRRRHLPAVLRIEGKVYPRPWSAGLFLSELAQKSSRAYFVARNRDASSGTRAS